MWGIGYLGCPVCGTPVEPYHAYCYRCGTVLMPVAQAPVAAYPVVPPSWAYAPPYAAPALKPLPGRRTKGALSLAVVALVLLAAPIVSPLGAFLLSIASTLLFLDRRGFNRAHRTAMEVSYALLWIAAVLYGILFASYLSAAYASWQAYLPMASLDGPTRFFIVATTVPTALLAAALGLQIWFLLPPARRHLARWCVLGLVALALIATVLALAYVPPSLGPDQIHVSTVLDVLNQVSLWRLAELPAFLGLAALTRIAGGNVVPGSMGASAPVAGRQG